MDRLKKTLFIMFIILMLLCFMLGTFGIVKIFVDVAFANQITEEQVCEIQTKIIKQAKSFMGQKDQKAKEIWKNIGKCRITCYCPYCNDGSGYESSTGKQLKYGYVACSWLDPGTKISIEGDIFEVADICGTEAIDIFIDHNEGYCNCNLNEYKNVSVKVIEK